MKFAENNRISHRQLYRQILLSFGAPFLLCLLEKNRLQGLSGIAGVLGALVLLCFYVIFLIRLTPFYGELYKTAGPVWSRAAGCFFVLYVIFTAAFLLSVLEEIVPDSLLSGVPGRWVSFLAALICSIGTHKGMQRRGRMAEVSGILFLGCVLLMMGLSLGQSRLSYLQEMWEGTGGPAGGPFLKSCYGVLCAFSGIGLLPFALEYVEKQGSAGKTVICGLCTLGVILAGMLLLLPAVFGWDRLLAEEYPILPLLAGADLPGNVLARFDVLWMGVLLYGMLFAIGSLFAYGHQAVRQARMGTGRFWIAAGAYGVSLLTINGQGIRDLYEIYLGTIFVPGLLLLQIFLLLRGRGRRRRTAGAAVLALALFLGGCGVEPEKRMYPLALGIDAEEDGGFVLTYGTADMREATGQEKSPEGESGQALSIRGDSFEEIEAVYNRSQEKYLDMGHIQVIVLGERLLREEKWEPVFRYLKGERCLGENVYVFRTEDPEKLMAFRGADGSSPGEYIIGLLENRTAGQQKQGRTLREMYHQWYREGTPGELPKILLENDEIQVILE